MTIDTREADMKTCPECNGDGVIEKGTGDEKQCPTCGGSGFVLDDNDNKNNEEVIRTSEASPQTDEIWWPAKT
jgi:DnaJ-class molecular chaperone